jgi:hypothetical protein
LPLRQGLVGFGEAVACPATLGATRCRWGVGAGLCLGVDVLLEEPGGQILPQFAGPLLTLVEGDELVLIFGSEHEVEGGGSMAEPALAEFVPLDIGVGLRIVHGGVSRWSRQGTPDVGYPIPTERAQERDCTRRRRRS